MNSMERRIIHQASERKSPVTGSLELTPLCNLNCRMCYVRLTSEEMSSMGRLHTIEEWLALGKQMQAAGVLFLLLTGGESLLYPGFREVYLGLRRMGFVLTINTNGTLIDEEWADFFQKYPPRRINITMYGASSHTYLELCGSGNGYEQVTRGIKLLKNAGVPLKIALSVTKLNAEDMERLILFADSMGIPCSCDTYMMPAVRERTVPFDAQVRLNPLEAAAARIQFLQLSMEENDFTEFCSKQLNIIRQREIEIYNSGQSRMENSCNINSITDCHMSCLAGSCSFTVNWQGLLRPCVVMCSPAENVFETSFSEAWTELRTQTDKIRISPECAACSKKILCKHCAAAALLEEDAYSGIPSYLCQYTDETIRLMEEAVKN